MAKFTLALAGLLAVFAAADSLAQTTDDSAYRRLPPASWPGEPQPSANQGFQGQSPFGELPQGATPFAPSLQPDSPFAQAGQPQDGQAYQLQPPGQPVQPPPQTPLLQNPTAPGGVPEPSGDPINLDGSPVLKGAASLSDFWGYRYLANGLEYIPGDAEEFGIFSVLLGRYVESGTNSGLMTGFGFHVFDGPIKSDMSPRAYDFSIGYQVRHRIGPLAFDLASAVQASSDFNGDAHKGIQYPGHGVGYFTVRPELDLVFGVDYLDRADIKLLPVAGVIWKPNPEMRFELVFPRPRAYFQLNETYRLYCYGELGGGSWAIERPGLGNNVATYRDIRTCIGLESVDKSGRLSAIEVGYLFDRRLDFTSCTGNLHLDDAVMVSLLTRF
jgi:hypothetical protein